MAVKNQDHLSLLCDIGELAALVTDSSDMDGFLKRAVELVACHLQAHVGSIYLFVESRKELVLRATMGLNPSAVGQIRMKSGEGLVGLALDTMQPICEGHASRNPQFKYFEQADEERFESLLAVPIQRGQVKIGVLVVQHETPNYFDGVDTLALRAIASQLAGALENLRLLMDIGTPEGSACTLDPSDGPCFYKGEAAAKGFAHAPAIVLAGKRHPLLDDLPDEQFETGQRAFRQAISDTTHQLKELQKRLTRRLQESATLIFEAHFMILKDQRFVERMATLIEEGQPAAKAVRQVARYYMQQFAASNSAYLREKKEDIEDLARRILKNLLVEKLQGQEELRHRIVIARQVYPSDILKLASEQIAGIVLVSGGVTSHVAILARSLAIPLVIADRRELLFIAPGTPVLLDGDVGNVYVNPSARIIAQFEERNAARSAGNTMAEGMRDQTMTDDGHRIVLMANINLISDLELAHRVKAEGVGLYRTEFPFLIRAGFPSEQEQYLIYKKLLDGMPDRPVTIRTLDVGGEKLLPYYDGGPEPNPELGLRSIRFSFRHPEHFDMQIRAILRAAADHPALCIMFPLIGSVEEFRQARRRVLDALHALSRDQLAHCRQVQIGLMIELPAAVEIADALAEEADFFSVGTNDFVQYMLGVDRTNEKVAEYYRCGHPAVLRGLNRVVKAARKAGIPVSVCGEMGHNPDYIPFFVGIGVTALSADPHFLPLVQTAIAELSLARAQAFAGELLSKSTSAAIQRSIQIFRESSASTTNGR